MRPIQDMLRGAGRLCPSSIITRSLHPKKAALQPGRSLRRLRTAAVLQSRAQPVAVPAASGRAVVGGGVTDPTVEVAPPTNDEVVLDHTDKPGVRDRQNFSLHWSVDYWQNFTLPPAIEGGENAPIPSRLQAIGRTLTDAASSAGIFSSSKAAAYWSYHITRSGFFAIQGIAGVLAARAASTVTGRSSEDTGIRIESIIKAGLTGPMAEALAMYYQDYRNIEQGVYKLPWDMTTSGHRQWSPFWVAQRTAQFVSEASATLKRRAEGTAEDVWLKSNLYPDYYLNTFHFQTDGWLSEQSAKVYEVSTETLFLGRQDAMQRQTLVPLHKFMMGRPANGTGVRALEVAAGTGRFATFTKDNYPKMDLTLLDLSPYYLLEARKNLKYWADKRAKGEALGGADGTGSNFLQAPAEAIPQPDASFDVVYSVYLFHELPPHIRRKTVAEMSRVLKPGGVAIITDSIQLGDRERLDSNLGRFGDFNEPFYRTYITEDFGAMFKEAGLEPDMKVMASSSKTLSFRKPHASSSPAPSNGRPAAQSSSPAPSTSSPAEESYDDITAAEQSAAEMGTVPAS